MKSLAYMYDLPNGGGWSPDGGSFWVRDHKAYWATGEITDLSQTGMAFRVGSSGDSKGEDYSKWTDEQRAKAEANTNREQAELRDTLRKMNVDRLALAKSARQKLTDAEWRAVVRREDIDMVSGA